MTDSLHHRRTRVARVLSAAEVAGRLTWWKSTTGYHLARPGWSRTYDLRTVEAFCDGLIVPPSTT